MHRGSYGQFWATATPEKSIKDKASFFINNLSLQPALLGRGISQVMQKNPDTVWAPLT
jgi:hypothetical protein